MQITKVSMFTDKEHTLDIPVTNEQLEKWNKGMVIQEAMPHLTPDQREFLMTGVTKEEWDKYMPEEDVEYPKNGDKILNMKTGKITTLFREE